MRYNLLKIIFLISLTGIIQVAAQNPGVGANFGIEADVYSGTTTSGTDDWFQGTTGMGVIDQSQQASFQSLIDSRSNTPFDTRMSRGNYTVHNGYVWYAARFGHDQVGSEGGVDDDTIFAQGKNGDNPETWEITSGSPGSKNDIIDSYVHMRRDGDSANDDLWVNLAVSTLEANGSHFLDFELFVRELQVSGSSFTNVGPNGGHTAWEFNPLTGDPLQIGDVTVGFSYTGQGVEGIEVRVWTRKFNYDNNIGFTYIKNKDGFVGSASVGGVTYGYASIDFTGNTYSRVNSVSALAPPWGTNATGLDSATAYQVNSLAEVAVNFTGIGFDPGTLFGNSFACDSPFSSVLVKSRTSAAFNASLKDFAGPYDFLGGEAGYTVDTSIQDPGDFPGCEPNEQLTLQANFISPSAEYTWRSLTPGVTFPDGSILRRGVGLNNIPINKPGEYSLNIAPLAGCSSDPTDASTITVGQDPIGSIDSQPVNTRVCEGSSAQFYVNTTNLDTYQWQISTNNGSTYSDLADGGPYAGVNTNTLTINPAVISMNNNLYRVVASSTASSCDSKVSSAAELIVESSVTVDSSPTDTTVFQNANAVFTVTGTNVDTYQWEVSTDNGVSFSPILDGANYNGVATSSLTVINTELSYSGFLFRAVLSNSSGACSMPATSSHALLTVKISTVITNRRITHRVKKN
ncbi:hypothetical protein [Arenibacter amylolyticus]|uniref:hypothetical protein n=1 Tax=Arenibacter amylolyticus TaxID=1406873 RepID=UPI000A397289|nr:hypothetical protein [Arenibacter amylolyticus]